MPLRVLILGGTTEASTLAGLLADRAEFNATLSLAGRTRSPRASPLDTRVGGFGGVEGLTRYLSEHAIEAVIDATHPYADQMSAHAVAACVQQGVPLATVVRPAWQAQSGDRWQVVPNTGVAASILGRAPRRVFLALGRQELPVFAAAAQHVYLARVIEKPDGAALPPQLRILQARGPFDLESELALLRDEKIDVVVSKNSGGHATYAKIEAARTLGLPVVMIARPHKAAGHVLVGARDAFDWLQQQAHARTPPSLRGV
jgi:precorrin-6A/cobalt-precorrin-6A reductase